MQLMAVLPTRLIPGAFLALVFTCVGLETGLLISAFIHASTAIPTHWACLPLFALALFYLRHTWRAGVHTHPVRRISALPPRLQVLIFTLCLVIGLGTAAVLALGPV